MKVEHKRHGTGGIEVLGVVFEACDGSGCHQKNATAIRCTWEDGAE